MPKTGYPTPDNPVGEMDFICKSIFLPNDAAFVAVLAGQIAEATRNWYWKQEGTMSPEQAAEYMSQALAMCDFDDFCGGSMTCENVADCIETNAAVQAALAAANLTNNDLTGASNPDHLSPAGTENTTIINNRFPPAQRAEPAHELENCNRDELWAGIYFMVQQLDNVGRDWLEQAVASGDKWQRAASIAKNIPIIGSLASTALEQLAEVAQDLLNLYNGYSTEAVLQDIACELFELVCAECRYPTYDEIADYYGSNSTITGGNLAEISLKAMVDFLIGSSLAISQLAYHTIISMVLFTLWMGSEFVGLRGARWVSIWLDNGEEYANDEWNVLCDGCNVEEVILQIGDGNCDSSGWVNIGTVTQLGLNYYEVTSQTHTDNGKYLALERQGGGKWRVTNVEHISGGFVQFWNDCTNGVSTFHQMSGGWDNGAFHEALLLMRNNQTSQNMTYRIVVEAE
jgi:hypothetical protein